MGTVSRKAGIILVHSNTFLQPENIYTPSAALHTRTTLQLAQGKHPAVAACRFRLLSSLGTVCGVLKHVDAREGCDRAPPPCPWDTLSQLM